MSEPVIAPTPTYQDYDLVYVDPDTNTVVGPVEWNPNGTPKSKPFVRPVGEAENFRKRWRQFYPLGTYKSMRNMYHLEGKRPKYVPDKTLEEILPKALTQAFWNDAPVAAAPASDLIA